MRSVVGISGRKDGEDVKSAAKDEAIVRAIVALARGLDMHTVAEGVETEAHFLRLRALGCHFFQGYFFARPMARQDFEQNVDAGRWRVSPLAALEKRLG
jgi:EAL domain-containing protein (putative c-di-GMP-specific phosphodiesterase class I)